MISGYDRLGPKFESLVRQRFNFATANWYTWKDEQPIDHRIEYGRMDSSIKWCLDRHITPKGFGYCYMSREATPEWVRENPARVRAGRYANDETIFGQTAVRRDYQ
jgi:hypothetical protein